MAQKIEAGFQVPDHAKADANSAVMNTRIGASNSLPALSLDEGQYVVKQGNEIKERMAGDFVDVLILGLPDGNGRAGYRDRYIPGGPVVNPWCYSLDGNTPHETVPEAQRINPTCEGCDWDKEGSSLDGGTYKRCSFTTQILVATIANPTSLMRMNINATTNFTKGNVEALQFGLSSYCDWARRKGLDLAYTVTRIQINRDTNVKGASKFIPLLTLDETDPQYIAAKQIKEQQDLKRLLLPGYVLFPAGKLLGNDQRAAVAPPTTQVQTQAPTQSLAQQSVAPSGAVFGDPANVQQPDIQQPAVQAPAPAPTPEVQQPAGGVPAEQPQVQQATPPPPASTQPAAGPVSLDSLPQGEGAVAAPPQGVGEHVPAATVDTSSVLPDVATMADSGALAELAEQAGMGAEAAVNPVANQPAVDQPIVQDTTPPASTVPVEQVAPEMVTEATQDAVANLNQLDVNSMLDGVSE